LLPHFLIPAERTGAKKCFCAAYSAAA